MQNNDYLIDANNKYTNNMPLTFSIKVIPTHKGAATRISGGDALPPHSPYF